MVFYIISNVSDTVTLGTQMTLGTQRRNLSPKVGHVCVPLNARAKDLWQLPAGLKRSQEQWEFNYGKQERVQIIQIHRYKTGDISFAALLR